GVWLLDADGWTVYANSRLAEMLDCTPEEVIGRRFEEFVFPADRPGTTRPEGLGACTGREPYDCRLHRKDGNELWAAVSTTPMFNEYGALAGSLKTLSDITEHRSAGEAFRWLATNARCLL